MFSSLLYLKYTHKTDLVLHQNFISPHSIDFSLCAAESARSVLSRLSYNTFRAESTVSVAPGSDITLGRERLELLVSGTIKKESLVLTSTFPAPRAARTAQREIEEQRESAYLIFLSAPANHYNMYIRVLVHIPLAMLRERERLLI